MSSASAAPVDVHRTGLYTPDELYDTATYAGSLDERAYHWSRRRAAHGQRGAIAEEHVTRALHDLAVDEALAVFCRRRRLVGVMGGHAARRDGGEYAEAARLGHRLGSGGLVVATGGGPGAMEAANLGCLLGNHDVAAVGEAVAALVAAPDHHPVDVWLAPARAVLASVTRPHPSLGVPTWFYGREPSNVFATAIAKYFRNALREAILLQICAAGIVFLPGAAGTVQEVFQDACENYYATPSALARMVLVGRDHWTATLPAWPLLQALARGGPMEDRVHLVDTVDEAADLVLGAAQATSRR